MICPKCGKELPDGSRFCGSCGEKLADSIKKEVSSNDNIAKSKKMTLNKKNLLILIPIIVVIAFIGIKVFIPMGNENVYVYAGNGEYRFVTDIENDDGIKLSSTNSISYEPKELGQNQNLFKFSSDGKYLYFFSKFDEETYSGTLCQAEYKKLKKDSSKNDKYIHIIATNVYGQIYYLDDDIIVYCRGDYKGTYNRDTNNGILCYYDGKEEIQINKGVSDFVPDDSGRIIYELVDDQEKVLYGADINKKDDALILATDYEDIVSWSDKFSNILLNGIEENSYILTGFESEMQKIENVSYVPTVNNNKVYYSLENDEKICLYNFIEDGYADEDSNFGEFDSSEYEEPTYVYNMISSDSYSENEYEDLYTSCIKPLYWYGSSRWYSYSMKEALDMDWGDHSDTIHQATQKFIDKFSNMADEEGYIPVTDEVKAALKEISKSSPESYSENDWLCLCYSKEQSGTRINYDLYNKGYDEWSKVQSRVVLRNELKDEKNAIPLVDLYCYDEGKSEIVCEQIFGWSVGYKDNGIIYIGKEQLKGKVNIEEVSSVDDVLDKLSIDDTEFGVINTESNKILSISSEALGEYNYNDILKYGCVNLYLGEKEAYLAYEGGALFTAEINNDTIEKFELLADNAQFLEFKEDTLYTFNNIYYNNDYAYCDLYSYKNGKATCLAKDVLEDNINIYEDDSVFAYAEYQPYVGYELVMFDSKGEKTQIANEVSKYVRVDTSTILYISNGNLYSYNGKNSQKIKDNVEWITSKEREEIKYTFGWNFYDRQYD